MALLADLIFCFCCFMIISWVIFNIVQVKLAEMYGDAHVLSAKLWCADKFSFWVSASDLEPPVCNKNVGKFWPIFSNIIHSSHFYLNSSFLANRPSVLTCSFWANMLMLSQHAHFERTLSQLTLMVRTQIHKWTSWTVLVILIIFSESMNMIE